MATLEDLLIRILSGGAGTSRLASAGGDTGGVTVQPLGAPAPSQFSEAAAAMDAAPAVAAPAPVAPPPPVAPVPPQQSAVGTYSPPAQRAASALTPGQIQAFQPEERGSALAPGLRPTPAMGPQGPQAAAGGRAPSGYQAPAPAAAAPQAPGAPRGGGIGGFLGNLLNPGGAAKNQTIGWLQQQGLDEGTATLLAGNKQMLQKYLYDRTLGGGDPATDALKREKLGLEVENLRNPTTDDIREYQFARQQGYEGTLPEFMREMKKAGATSVTTNVGETTGWEAIDKNFAPEYFEWTKGGFADTEKQIAQLNDALQILESGGAVTGPVMGALPDFVKPFFNQEGVIAKDRVAEVSQRSLKAILGAQFTEKEGEKLIQRTYNESLPPAENARRVRALLGQIMAMGQAKQAMVDYFNENGTLRGYQGPTPKLSDLDSIQFGGAPGGGGAGAGGNDPLGIR